MRTTTALKKKSFNKEMKSHLTTSISAQQSILVKEKEKIKEKKEEEEESMEIQLERCGKEIARLSVGLAHLQEDKETYSRMLEELQQHPYKSRVKEAVFRQRVATIKQFDEISKRFDRLIIKSIPKSLMESHMSAVRLFTNTLAKHYSTFCSIWSEIEELEEMNENKVLFDFADSTNFSKLPRINKSYKDLLCIFQEPLLPPIDLETELATALDLKPSSPFFSSNSSLSSISSLPLSLSSKTAPRCHLGWLSRRNNVPLLNTSCLHNTTDNSALSLLSSLPSSSLRKRHKINKKTINNEPLLQKNKEEQLLKEIEFQQMDHEKEQEIVTNEEKKRIQLMCQEVGLINEMTKDMDHLISEQGQHLEIVTDKMENTKTRILHAESELQSATVSSIYNRRLILSVGLGCIGAASGIIAAGPLGFALSSKLLLGMVTGGGAVLGALTGRVII